ncbi:MAG: hypothetical protein HUU11_15900 [Anaerolineales bacterium]|nr:hypothetical protein [Anaerolineales bacterium]
MTMEFFFPEDHLDRMTPEETRITSLSAEPYPDGRRLRVNIEITPFQKRPHLDVAIKDGDGDEVTSASLVEPLSWKIEFTMHIRGERKNPYTLEATLFYPDGPSAEPQCFTFDVIPPEPFDSNSGQA